MPKRLLSTHQKDEIVALVASVFDQAPIAIRLIAEDGTILACNVAHETLTGLTRAEMVGKNVANWSYPEDRILDKQRIAIMMAAGPGDSVLFEKRLIKADGSDIWVEIKAAPHFDTNGQILFFASFVVDITARKAKETFLRDELEETTIALDDLNAILEATGVYLTDAAYPGGQPKFYGPMREALQLPPDLPEDQLLTEFRRYVLPDDYNALRSKINASRVGQLERIEFRMNRPDGSLVWMEYSGKIVGNEQGNPSRLLGIVRDITRKKSIEEKMSFMQEQLITASKLAEVGEVSSSIAHEINDPLMVIGASASLLAKMVDKHSLELGDVADATETIEKSVKRINDIVQSIKRLSQKDQTTFAPTSLRHILDDVGNLCRGKMKVHKIDFKIDPVPHDFTMDCNQIQIAQIVLNLINNAYHEVRNYGEKWIHVKVTSDDRNVELRVTDSGPGIPEEIADKMFGAFFSTKAAGKGTGLGLHICKKLAVNHGGDIFIDKSAPNTSFVVVLPRTQNTTRVENAP